MNQIDPELLKRLDLIGQKLGVVAGDAWRIFLRQAYVEAWSWLPYCLVWGSGALLFLFLSRKCANLRKTTVGDDWVIGEYFAYCAMFGCAIGLAAVFSSVISLVANPEGYALREILFRLK